MKTLKLNITDKQNIFFLADAHLGHENILKYTNRPFESIEEMDKVIIDSWNARITKDDIVFILGDFCLLGVTSWVYFLSRLNGMKYLINGNHDKSIPKSGFVEVTPLKNILIEDPEITDGQRITLCHYPMLCWYQSHRGAWQLFGHVHSGPRTFTMDRISPNQYDVGVDNNNFNPVSYQEIKEIITQQNLK